MQGESWMKSRRIQTKKIYEEVADSLIMMIKTKELKPGDQLESVEQLAEIFAVSRSAVREALSGMRAMGLVEMRQGEGTFVTKFDPSNFSLPVTAGLLMKIDDVKALYEVRKFLEVGAASSAAIHHDERDLIPLKEAIDEMINAKKDGDIVEEADIRFHLAIAKATHNQILISLMRSVSKITINVLHDVREILIESDNSNRSLVDEHLLIYEAIKNRQPEEAQKYMLEHLSNVEKSLENYLDFRK